MVTGKNKEQFEKWLMINLGSNSSHIYSSYNFDQFPLEMQIGVYLSYYDSLGYGITFGKGRFTLKDKYYYWCIEVDGVKGLYEQSETNTTRPEAYEQAFKKADELINEKLR